MRPPYSPFTTHHSPTKLLDHKSLQARRCKDLKKEKAPETNACAESAEITRKRKRAQLAPRPFFPLSRKFGQHPNPVRIRMLPDAMVKYERYRPYFPPLDLLGAIPRSWLPAFAFRHAYIDCVRQIRVISSRLPGLRSRAPIYSLPAVHGDAGLLLAAIFSNHRAEADRSGPSMGIELTFVQFRRSVAERYSRLAHRFVLPVEPAARQTRQILDRAAKHCQDTDFTDFFESFFSTIFRIKPWGNKTQIFSKVCQVLLKTMERLFAGISTTVSSSSPLRRASGWMSRSRSRTPQDGSRAFKLTSNASFEGAV